MEEWEHMPWRAWIMYTSIDFSLSRISVSVIPFSASNLKSISNITRKMDTQFVSARAF